jgi:hypothetical protein
MHVLCISGHDLTDWLQWKPYVMCVKGCGSTLMPDRAHVDGLVGACSPPGNHESPGNHLEEWFTFVIDQSMSVRLSRMPRIDVVRLVLRCVKPTMPMPVMD